MRRISVITVMMGIGYLLANTPSVWNYVVYAIPIISLCLFFAAIYVLIFGKAK